MYRQAPHRPRGYRDSLLVGHIESDSLLAGYTGPDSLLAGYTGPDSLPARGLFDTATRGASEFTDRSLLLFVSGKVIERLVLCPELFDAFAFTAVTRRRLLDIRVDRPAPVTDKKLYCWHSSALVVRTEICIGPGYALTLDSARPGTHTQTLNSVSAHPQIDGGRTAHRR